MEEGLGFRRHLPWADNYYQVGLRTAEEYATVIRSSREPARNRRLDHNRRRCCQVVGFGVTALASEPPKGLIGVVNFSGGRGRPRNYVNHDEDALVGVVAACTARPPGSRRFGSIPKPIDFSGPSWWSVCSKPMPMAVRRCAMINTARYGTPAKGTAFLCDLVAASSGVRASAHF